MVVFVCSPYRGEINQNVKNAISYCEMEMALGNTPYAPHLFFPRIIENDEDGIAHGIEMLQRCDEIHVWGGTFSHGMKQEIAFAESVGIPVRYMERV